MISTAAEDPAKTSSPIPSCVSMPPPGSGNGTTSLCTTDFGITYAIAPQPGIHHGNGKHIDAVVQLTKQGFAFVFDRVSGVPVWPIEERPVAASDIKGEHSWPTQPFPTKPAAISPQAFLSTMRSTSRRNSKAEAQAEMKKFRIGPLFTLPLSRARSCPPA